MRVRNYKSVYQLTYLPKTFPINVYVIEYENWLCLIDTGIRGMAKGIAEFSEKLGKPIEKILITHSHSDHIGGLSALKKYIPTVKVYVSKRDSRFLNGDFSLDPDEPQLPLKGGYPKQTLEFDGVLSDGDRLGDIRCIAMPGHTPGLMGYFLEGDRVLVVGDALQTRGGLAVAGTVKWIFPFPAMATWSKRLALDSAKKIMDLKPVVIGCGHGDMLFDGEHKLQSAIEVAQCHLSD